MVGAGSCGQFRVAEVRGFSQGFLLCLNEALGRGPHTEPKENLDTP